MCCRSTQRAEAADPDGVSDFWSKAQASYHGSALRLLGQVDEGLAKMDPAMAIYESMGLRTNFTLWNVSRAQGLAEAGRIEEAECFARQDSIDAADVARVGGQAGGDLAATAVRRARGEGDACTDALERRLANRRRRGRRPPGAGDGGGLRHHALICAPTRLDGFGEASERVERGVEADVAAQHEYDLVRARRRSRQLLGDLGEVAGVRRSVCRRG